MKRLQGQIVAQMGNSCTARCTVGGNLYTVVYKPVQRTQIPKDALLRLETCHLDIYREYAVTTSSRRFSVKRQDAA